MKNPAFRLSAILLMLAVTGSAAWAQMPMPMPAPMPGYGPMMPGYPGGMGPQGMPPGMRAPVNPLAALGLTEEQRNKLAEIAKEGRAQNVKIMSEIGNQFEALKKLFVAAQPDAKKIGAAYQQIFDRQRQAIELAVQMYNRQIAVLNKEQLQKWNAMREQMLARMLPPAPKKP